jgi:phosphate butyryltransferase
VFPNIQAGNTFYKTLTLFAGAEVAGLIVGTTAPVVVASRADSEVSKYYSLLMACRLKIEDCEADERMRIMKNANNEE